MRDEHRTVGVEQDNRLVCKCIVVNDGGGQAASTGAFHPEDSGIEST